MINRVFLVFTVILMLSGQQIAQCQPLIEDVQNDFEEAFKLVEAADLNSGEISILVNELNSILELLESGYETDLIAASNRISAVKNSALSSSVSGQEYTQSQLLNSGIILFITCVLVMIVWRFMPKLVWKLWIRSRKYWLIKFD